MEITAGTCLLVFVRVGPFIIFLLASVINDKPHSPELSMILFRFLKDGSFVSYAILVAWQALDLLLGKYHGCCDYLTFSTTMVCKFIYLNKSFNLLSNSLITLNLFSLPIVIEIIEHANLVVAALMGALSYNIE